MTTQQKRRRINWWKWGFLFLLSANFALFAVVSSRLLEPREVTVQKPSATRSKEDIIIGQVTTKRDQLNQTITAYLESYQTKNLSYDVHVGTTTVLFRGTYKLLGYQVPLYIYFNPYQMADGSIQLRIESFSVGTLPLPAADVLRYVRANYKLPEVVTVLPKEETISIDLTKLNNKQGIYLKARQIDLLSDAIILDIYKKK